MEFGIVMTAIIVVVLGTYDIGNFLLQQMKLAEAAEAGGQDAVSYPPTDVNNASEPNTQILMGAIASALPQNWAAGSDYTVTLAQNCICNAGSANERYVTVTLSRPYRSLLGIPGLAMTTASYVARIQ